MPVAVVMPPPLVLGLAEVKKHLRVEVADDDDLILGLMAASQGSIDGPHGWLGRAVGPQTLELSDICPNDRGRISLPCPPILNIVWVKDAAGVAADPAVYTVRTDGVLVLQAGQGWPWTSWTDVTVRFEAGYPLIPAAGDVPAQWSGPPALRAAMLLMVADLYEFRGGKVSNGLIDNPSIKSLLMNFYVPTV